jgi:hypothetical protein
MNAVRRVVTVVVLAALLLPVIRDRDSFPLSTYPMYAFERPDVVAFPTAVGIDSEGVRHRLDLDLIGESDDPLIVASLVRQAVRAGGGAATILCTEIAARAVQRELGLTAIEVVTERHDVVARATDEPSLVSSERHASCVLERPG